MIIIDYSGVVHAACHISIASPEDLNEKYVRHLVLNVIQSLIRKHQKKYGVAFIAFDNAPYWRKREFEHYKSTRKDKKPTGIDYEEMYRIINQIKDELKTHFPYPTLDVKGCEADDCIGYLCKKYGDTTDTLIVSNDQDFYHLHAYKKVRQYVPNKKQVIKHDRPDYALIEKIMRGDKGDGIPNVRSVNNSFADKIRQKPVTQKLIDSVYQEILMKGDISTVIPDDMERYEENKRLIQLTDLPDYVITEIEKGLSQINVAELNERKKTLYTYFLSNGLGDLVGKLANFM